MPTSWEKPPITGVVVTGHPGIDVLLFTDSGPVIHNGRSIISFLSGTWALVDSGSGNGQPCLAFQISHQSDVFLVQTTPLQPDSYKKWQKQRLGTRMFVMECVTDIEMQALGKLYSLDVDQIMKHYKLWGPSVRTCFNLVAGTLSTQAMEWQTMFAARKFTFCGLPLMDDPDRSDVSNILFSIHPENSSREIMRAKIAADHILEIVLGRLSWLGAAEQSRFFDMIRGHPWLKSPLGIFYKKLTHVRLTVDPAAASLTCIPKKKKKRLVSIPVVSNVVSLSGSSNLQAADQNAIPFCWRPVSQTFTSPDAIIVTMTMIFLLKSTVSPGLNPKELGLDFIRQHIPEGFWKNRRCMIVYITPDEARGLKLTSEKYSALKAFPELELGYCVFPVGTSTFTSLQLKELRKHEPAEEVEEDSSDEEDSADEDNPIIGNFYCAPFLPGSNHH